MIGELNTLLLGADQSTRKDSLRDESGNEIKGGIAVKHLPISAELSTTMTGKQSSESETQYITKKVEALHRNIMRYQDLFKRLSTLAGGPAFLLLDDLYHLRLPDQANVVDYFHRIAKGTNVWLKIGTIRHRSRWYTLGHPPIGMKLGDDADEIDLDVLQRTTDFSSRQPDRDRIHPSRVRLL
jgi:hypothetical protein